MKRTYKVRFKLHGKPKSFKCSANSSKEAASKCRNGRVISVRKV